MRFVLRVCAVLALSCLLVPASFAAGPAAPKNKPKRVANSDAKPLPAGVKATADSPARSAANSPAGTPAGTAVPAAAKPRPAAQKRRVVGTEREAPEWSPIPATTGGLGLFTVETGETLPVRGLSFSTYVNKFSRMPGSVSVLNLGWNFGWGIRNWATLFVGFEPYRHTHVGAPGQLSLRTPSSGDPRFQQFGTTIYRTLGQGQRPAYVEDFPFAANNDGGVGEVTLGLKLGLLSEMRGHPVSLSVRNDFIIPTRTTLPDLLDNGTQSGQFNYNVAVALSKNWRYVIPTLNWGYRFTRDPRSAGQRAMTQADQIRVGAGLVLFPQSRVQILQEYTGLVYVGSATPNQTFGARDPVDGVWGVRVYPWKYVALDVGYRYMLNLKNANDRHGFVVKFGTVYWPEKIKPNNPPVASCSAEKNSIYAGSDETVGVRVQASDPDGDPLTYSWTATGGRVDGSGAQVRWNPAGTMPGTYTVTAHVDDGRGGTASCAVDVRVDPRPNRPPTISCSVDRSSVLAGERVRITAVASDPDGDPLTYAWRTNGGQILGSGAAVQFDTSGLNPGRYTVTGRVDDGRGAAADCSASVEVQAPPPPPQASKINECIFRASSARVDNVCKRILDDVALRLKNEPRASVVIVGYADPKEPKPPKLAGQRAENTAKYLASKGIDRGRINVRAAGGQKGAGKQNRRIDIVWVPEGASF